MTRTAALHLDELTPRARLGEGAIHELLGYQLAQAAIITTASFEKEVGRPFELRPVEFTLLQLIMENIDVSPTRLAQALAMKTPGITVWIDRLVARRLVMRERSDTDGRARHLRVTEEGQALVTQALDRLLEADRAVLQHLSPGEQKILVELLRKVARARPALG
jgi:DNA-binding MarR family transcriptional regulator